MSPTSDDEFEYFYFTDLSTSMYVKTHAVSACQGRPCCLHSPSDHHMKEWPIMLREDKHWLAERRCQHGVGHPDPDSMEYIKSTLPDGEGTWYGVHGCCAERCCRGEK